jgi:hypothetical protein
VVQRIAKFRTARDGIYPLGNGNYNFRIWIDD